mmetsp:Transcript_13159/g.21895  ORF Transcript_13159/g.21895 Transcript_13159/m.21895 type:complete len:237 (-) Transcript_13159:57-767(-)
MGYILVASTVVEQSFTVAMSQYTPNSSFRTFQDSMSFAVNVRSRIIREIDHCKRTSATPVPVQKRSRRSKEDHDIYLQSTSISSTTAMNAYQDDSTLLTSVKRQRFRDEGGINLHLAAQETPHIWSTAQSNENNPANRGGATEIRTCMPGFSESAINHNYTLPNNTVRLIEVITKKQYWTKERIIGYLRGNNQDWADPGGPKAVYQRALFDYFIQQGMDEETARRQQYEPEPVNTV